MKSPLQSQRDLFPLEYGDGYLNGASRSPQLKAVAAAARHALSWREAHSHMPIPAFFDPVSSVKSEFAKLIGCPDPECIALIPSASYGISTVAKNLPLRRGQNIIIAEDQFPSNYYAWARLCREREAELRIVARPVDGRSWSVAVGEAIDSATAAVAIAQLHWADGTLFDLPDLRRRTDGVGAWLVIDGTQSVGAFPFDVSLIRPDALVAGGYKWLMGPYGCGYAYYGERMDGGVPLEENWINRAGSEDFRRLVDYREDYRPKAGRYSVGEHSNFIFVPMMEAALSQVNAWGPDRIQTYTGGLWEPILPRLRALGVRLPESYGNHLVGLRLPTTIDGDRLTKALADRRLQVSYRGDAVRVSPNVYNFGGEMLRLAEALEEAVV